MLLKKSRYDYFLIWGHGMRFQSDIKKIIEDVPEFKIVKEINYNVNNIQKLVKKIYSYDYAPFHHLKSKTEYLKYTSSRVKIIFIKNNYPIENYYGEGRFLHIECERIKNTKEKIRDKFNERKENRRTENHVVHASDNETQTDYILKFLGFTRGIETFERNIDKIISAPYHLKIPKLYSIREIDMNLLLCTIIINSKTEIVKLEDSPQFKGGKYYDDYLAKYNGKILQDGYSTDKYQNLVKSFNYLDDSYPVDYIITKQLDDKFLILDGLHRASILKKRKTKKVKVIVL